MRTIELTVLALLSTALPLLGCSSEQGSAPVPPDDTNNTSNGPTFHKDVEPILQQHCQSCHAPGQIAPFSLMSYEDTAATAQLLVARTQDRSMPPWGAIETDECQPRFGWKHDARLSDAEIATIAAWKDAGSPKGDPKDAPTAGAAKGDDLTQVDLELAPKKPFTASGDKDQMICFVLDPKFTEDVYVNASKIVPGNLKVAHHGAIFVDAKGESVAHANADGYYECFGTPGISTVTLLTPWVPGAGATVAPPNVGTLVTAGSKLVLQMHYHPAGTTADPDMSKLQLQFHPGVPEYKAVFVPVGAPVELPNGDGLQPGMNDKNGVEFLIPAGAKAHVEAIKMTLPAEGEDGQPLPEMKVSSAQSHMHYVGVDEKITVHRQAPQGGDPADECVLQTPKWDFNWQQTYTYNAAIEELPTLRAGDVVTVRCTYDNTMDNPFLKKALMEQKLSAPKDVSFGETTLDEMCVGVLSVFIKN